ncbi:MAG: phage terminase small subunit P27 family [Elusimicrobiales bacterium]|nr:phage terminase small subunit P27 family [Elusimicrobiales bacterium]
MKGRKPKTRVYKLFHGTRKSRINPREPVPVGAIGEPPDWLDDVSKAYWREVTKTMGRSWTAADRGPLEVLCKSYSRWRQTESELEVKGTTYYPKGVKEIVIGSTTKLVGETRKRPQVAIENMYYSQYCRLCAEFGITPTARTRIIGPKGFIGEDPILDDL